MNKLVHRHALITTYVKNPPTSEVEGMEFLTELVKRVNLNVLAGPFVKYLDEEGNKGLSGMVMITTSHASFHCWDENAPYLFQCDVYSCKEFNQQDVVELIDERFGIVDKTVNFIDRNYAYPFENK